MVKFRKLNKIQNNNKTNKTDSKNKKFSYNYINSEKNKIREKNPNIFHFNKESSFIYESRRCIYFYSKLENNNKMKPNSDEFTFLKEYEKNYPTNGENISNQKYIEIPQNLAIFISNRIKIIPKLDDRAINVQNLIKNHKHERLSCRALAELYKNTYNKKISKTTINTILKYHLGLKYLKTSVKNEILLSSESIKQTYFILKIIIRHLKLGGKIIFIDESTFYTKNINFKTWRKSSEFIFNSFKDNKKRNLILAVSNEKIIHWEINSDNFSSENFLNFIDDILESLDNNDNSIYILFMDNASIHLSLDLMKFYSKNKLKILFNVPYASFFNMAELCFRAIKKIIYGFIFSSIEEVESKVIEILKSDKLNAQIPLLYKETLREYIKFIDDNININLNFS